MRMIFAISPKSCKFAHRKAIGLLKFFQVDYWLLVEGLEGENREFSGCPSTSWYPTISSMNPDNG